MPTSAARVGFGGAAARDLRRDAAVLPAIEIRGEGLTYAGAVLTYTVGGKAPSGEVFHADGDVVAAVSSATGINIIRRVSS